jgi:hypothetical protein
MIRSAESRLGAFLRAVSLLGANSDESRAALAQYFGFDYAAAKSIEEKIDPLPSTPAQTREETSHISPASHTSLAANRIPIEISPLPEPEGDRPQWLGSAVPLPLDRKRSRVIPVKQSLFDPLWARGILNAALATTTRSNDIDIDRVVQARSAGDILRDVPFHQVLTLSRGVYCWVDTGPAMEPFYQDQGQLVAELINVVGNSRLQVINTDSVPSVDSFVPAVPHLILSDLGVTAMPDEIPRSTPQMWAEFAALVANQFTSEVVALVPRAVEDYPPAVRAAIRIVQWDRPTSVQTVRAIRTPAYG